MSDIQTQFLLFKIREFKDRQAFDKLYTQHQSAVRRYLSLKLPTPSDVDDAHSITFLRLWSYLTSGARVENLTGLIFTIGRSVVAEYYQKRRTGDVSLDAIEYELSGDGAGKIEAGAEISMVKDALLKMSEEYRLIISLRHFEGLSIREIAKRIQKSENATAVMLHRATKAFRQQFEDGTKK